MHERYFDYAATTPVDPRVIEAMLPWMYESPGNAHSIHHYGLKAHDAVEKARAQVAALIGADDPSQITFTSGATEANNWVLHALRDQIEVSEFEHSSIRETAERLGIKTFRAPSPEPRPRSNSVGTPPADARIYALMAVNNETGTIFDENARPTGAHLVDATQAIGKIRFQVGELEYVTGSAHKFYGPKGVGFLYQRFPGSIPPLITGGGQERGERSGTLNVPAIIGMGMAAELAAAEIDGRREAITELETWFWHGLEKGDKPHQPPISDYIINGGENRSPYILSLSFAGIEGETLLIELDQAGFCCSAGAACSSQNTESSPVLKAFGVPDEYIRGTIRISFSHHNTEESTYQLAIKIREIVERLRRM